jgi:uncharacterized protein (TIGR00288 family)
VWCAASPRTSMPPPPSDAERNLAVFIELENLAMAFQSKTGSFDVNKVLERLLDKGKIIVKKAYCDWSRFPQYTGPFHGAAIELIEIPKRAMTGKNSADIRMVVDAMDLAWSKPHVDTFVIVSGDSDFSPLVSKLKENGKHVIGVGARGSTSGLLSDNCDEFIYYEDLERASPQAARLESQLPEKKREVFALLLDTCVALVRENHTRLHASLIKDTMKRKRPSFDESYYGYRSFNHLLEDARTLGIIEIEREPRSGTYMVTKFGEGETPRKAEEAVPRSPRRRRRRRKAGALTPS